MNEVKPTLSDSYSQVAFDTLLQISNLINTADSFETVLEYVIDVMKTLVGAAGAGLLLYDQEKKSLVLKVLAIICSTFKPQLYESFKFNVQKLNIKVNILNTI